MTALAVPTGFTQPHLAAFPSTLWHKSTTGPTYRSVLCQSLSQGYPCDMGPVGQSPFHLPTCLWKCESLPDCENPPRPALPMFGGSGEAKASPQYTHWHLGTFTRWKTLLGTSDINFSAASTDAGGVWVLRCRGTVWWHHQLSGLPLEKVGVTGDHRFWLFKIKWCLKLNLFAGD